MSEPHTVPPWSPAQVKSLNDYQRSGVMHPFTCGGEHEHHVDLLATEDGWVCPDGCGYTQAWAHAWMADDSWRAAVENWMTGG